MEEENMGNIRTNTRNLLQLNRRIHRDEINDIQRSVTSRSTKQDITEIVKKLKTKACISARDLNQLKNAVIEEPQNIALVLGVHGAIRGIIGQLIGNDTKKQCAAAGCLCNLSTGDRKACLSVSRAAGPYLVQAVDNMTLELAVTCAWTLGNLSASSMKTCELLIAQGALSKLMYVHPNKELQDACLYGLKHLVYQLGDALKFNDLNASVQVLSKVEFNTESSQIFFILSCHQSFAEILTEEILTILLEYSMRCMEEYLSYKEKCSHYELVYTFRTLANTNEKICEYILDFFIKRNAGTLFKEVLSLDNSFVNSSLLWLLGNIYNTCNNKEVFSLLIS